MPLAPPSEVAEAGPRGEPGSVDAHQHVWNLDEVPQPWIDPVRMAPIARSFPLQEARGLAATVGVSRTVVVQTVPQADETPLLLAMADREPFVAGVVGWVDLEAPDVGEQLDRLRAGPGGRWLVGIRHLVQDEPDPDWLDRPRVRAGLRRVAAAGLPFDLLVKPAQYAAAVRVVQTLPQLHFVLDHLGKPPIGTGELDPWLGTMTSLAACPNLTVKLSGLVTEASWDSWRVGDLRPYVEAALTAFGPTRLAAGSDWPVCELASGGYLAWWSALNTLLAQLGAAESAAVHGGTATAVYHLER